MALVINTNTAASASANSLNANNAALQKSLLRLSSGFKITQPSDDAGGLGVSQKMQAAISRTGATETNISNALSFLQTQDGALEITGKILNRMSELKTLHGDVTKNTTDKANYDKEFTELQAQLTNLVAEKFNGVGLFGAASVGSVLTTEDGAAAQAVDLTACDLAGAEGENGDPASGIFAVTEAADLAAATIADFTTSIENVAGLRAQNGAQSSRLQYANDMLAINRVNLEAANSRIIDTDVAAESTRYAKLQILTQSSTAMLAQANTLPQAALKLLG